MLDPDDCSATNTSETAEWDLTFLRLMKLKMTNVNLYIESICKSQTQALSHLGVMTLHYDGREVLVKALLLSLLGRLFLCALPYC